MEAKVSDEVENWKGDIDEEINSLHKNSTFHMKFDRTSGRKEDRQMQMGVCYERLSFFFLQEIVRYKFRLDAKG